MAAAVSLDNVAFWVPPATAQADEERNHTSAFSNQTTDEPIWISSDAESSSDMEDTESGNSYRDIDGWRSDDTLPSAKTLVASIAKALPNNTGHIGEFSQCSTLVPSRG